MSDAYLDSDLILDIRQALAQVDRLNEAVHRATTNIRATVDARQVTAAIDAAVEAADATVEAEAEAGRVTGAIDSAVDAADTTVSVNGTVSPTLRDGIEDIADDAERAADGAGRLRAALGALSVGAVARGLFGLADAASELEQAVGGTEAVFGEAAAIIDEFAVGAANAAGLTETAARTLTSQIGGLLKGFQFTREEAARTSVQLAQLGADLAATFGGRPEEAVEALGAALRGEFNPLERFGIALNVAQIEAYALANGLVASKSEMTLAVRAQAALALIMERSADAQGQFNRELDTAGGAMSVFRAEAGNLAAQAGANLTPALIYLIDVLREDVLPGLAEVGEQVLPAVGDAIINLAPLMGSLTDVLVALAPVIEMVARFFAALPDPVVNVAAAFIGLRTALRFIPESVRSVSALTAAIGRMSAQHASVRLLTSGLSALRAALLTPVGGAIGLVAGVAGLVALTNTDAGAGVGAFAGQIVQLADSLTFGFGDGRAAKVAEDLQELVGALDLSQLENQRIAVKALDEELRRLASEEGKGRLFSLGSVNIFATGGDADRQERIDQIREQIAALEDQAEAEITAGLATGAYTEEQVAAARAEAARTGAVSPVLDALARLRVVQEENTRAAQRTLDRYGPLARQFVNTGEAMDRLSQSAPEVERQIAALRYAGGGTERQFLDLALAMHEAELSEEDMADAAAILGVEVEDMAAIVEQAGAALGTFVDTAVGKLPTIADAFAATGEDSILSVQEFLAALDESRERMATFRSDLQALAEAGFADIAGIIAEQGPEVGGALASELVGALETGNVEVLDAVREATTGFQEEWTETSTWYRESLGPEMILQSGLLGEGLTEAFGSNLSFDERLRIAGGLAKLQMSNEGKAVAAIAAAEGERAARDYGNALGLDDEVIEEAIKAGNRLRNMPTGDAREGGRRTGAAYGEGMESGIFGMFGRVANAAARLVREAAAKARAEAREASPSRLFAEIGENMALGMAVGMDAETARVRDSSAALVAAAADAAMRADRALVAPGFVSDSTAATGSGGTVLHIAQGAVVVSFSGAVSEADARMVGGAVLDGIVDAAFRRQVAVDIRTSRGQVI